MTDTIEPALTPDEWKHAMEYVVPEVLITGVEFYVGDADTAFKAIAELNAALPDDDPRKITRAHVEMLRGIVVNVRASELPGYGVPILDLAEKLAALLPLST